MLNYKVFALLGIAACLGCAESDTKYQAQPVETGVVNDEPKIIRELETALQNGDFTNQNPVTKQFIERCLVASELRIRVDSHSHEVRRLNSLLEIVDQAEAELIDEATKTKTEIAFAQQMTVLQRIRGRINSERELVLRQREILETRLVQLSNKKRAQFIAHN